MKKIVLFFMFSCFAFSFSYDRVFAQGKGKKEKKETRSKKEDKVLKEQMKEYYYDIEKFEELKNSREEAKRKIDSLNVEIAKLKTQEEQSSQKANELRNERNAIQDKIRKLDEEASKPPEKKVIPSGGVFFSVQIGAYNKRDISKLINEYDADLNMETTPVGMRKYLLGLYNTYEDAKKGKAYIRSLGVKDAWIVAYKDGKRVHIKEALLPPSSSKTNTKKEKENTPKKETKEEAPAEGNK